MQALSRVISAALWSLLHDVGKPILRYVMRAENNVEEADALMDLDRLLGEARSVRSHEKISEELWNKIAERLGFEDREFEKAFKEIKDIVKDADVCAALERGLEGELSEARERWQAVESEVQKQLPGYTHYNAPLLSPLWLTIVSDEYSYTKFIGPRTEKGQGRSGHGGFSGVILGEKVCSELEEVRSRFESRDYEKLGPALAGLLQKLRDKPLWYPPRLVDTKYLESLAPKTYLESLKETSYASIVRYLVKSLNSMLNAYRRVGLGFVETFAEVLKYSTMLVPSAVYLAVVPDIGLYSHSKVVSALATSMLLGNNSFRLLVIDARGIQSFVSSVVSPRAASRVIRGRSLLVELLTDALIEYALALFGGLPRTNVLVDEGGSVVLVVPGHADEGMDLYLRKMREVVRESARRYSLRWSIAYSSPLSRKKCASGLLGCGGGSSAGFRSALDELAERLPLAKAVDDAELLGVEHDVGDIAGFDALTRDVVTKSDLASGAGFAVADDSAAYASTISGGKLEKGDLVSGLTHLSLVAGSLSRNLILVVSVHVFRSSGQAGVAEPAGEAIEKLRDRLLEELRNATGERFAKSLSFEFSSGGYRFGVGVIPLPELGSLYILASRVDAVSVKEPPEAVQAVAALFKSLYGTVLKPALEGLGGGVFVKVRIRAVNVASEFIDLVESLSGVIGELSERGFEVSVQTLFTGVYHPVKVTESSGVRTYSLKDLDEYPMIAMAKSDGDYVGEVRMLLSSSPSRLVTFSDILTVAVNGKLHRLMLARGGDTIVLYAGGDDVSVYGDWFDVVESVYMFYRDVAPAVYPLSFSTGVYIADSRTPLLELYKRAVAVLNALKHRARGGVVLEPLTSESVVSGSATLKALKPLNSSTGWQGYGGLLSLEKIVELLKKPEFMAFVSEFKRDLVLLSKIAGDYLETLKAPPGAQAKLRLASLVNYYAYMCARRGGELDRHTPALLGHKLCYEVGEGNESVEDALRRLANLKTLLDLALLKERLSLPRPEV
ncbi:Cas10/Cmr2 second palm domain-containing protein [Thermogladius sp.]|uniref:Cas10/Cmr2 second palm domain-containing protein n=1 Tax=Thermogladius sp. TaxID=2023064 RepID=UPI003D0D19D8